MPLPWHAIVAFLSCFGCARAPAVYDAPKVGSLTRRRYTRRTSTPFLPHQWLQRRQKSKSHCKCILFVREVQSSPVISHPGISNYCLFRTVQTFP
uniref:Putative secreted protein n=1 Tax=Ixodes ricinus TaxID=34613 RepID=A0A6B0UCV3_IXORI